jgi:hypothetical protein
MPKYEQVDDSITYRPYSERPSLCSRPSPSILIGERNYSAGVGNNASIAERIQLTVDEMIKTRYLNSSINSLDHEVMDPALDESLHARMNPDVACPRSDATKSKSSETINAQPSIIPNGLAPVDGQKRPTKSDITCSKTRVEVKKPRPCSKRIRQVSIAPVRVEFPHTNTQPAYVGIYESISKAIADIFEKNHGQLSSICAYGRESRIIQVYPGERAPNSHEIRQRGLETIWLPLQDKSGSRALLDAMLSDELLVQSNCPSSPSNSSSPTKSGSVQKRSPMAEVSLNKASKPTRETPAKPPVESALEGNKNGPNVAMRPNIDTVTASEYMSYGDTWDSEDGSVLKLDTESDLENSLMSYSSRGTEEHNKITIDNQRELGGTSLQQYPAGVDQIISSCKIDRGKVRTQQRDTLRLSHKIQYSVHKGGEEMEARRCDLPLAKGFPFTAYAVQLLEHSDSCESAQCPDNMNHNQENELLQLLGSPSGLKPKHRKDRKIDQLNIPGTTQSKRQRQCATTSTTLRNGRSKFASLHLESKSDAESDRKPCNPGISDKLLADSVTILHGRSSCDYAHNGQGLSSLIQGEGKKVSGLVEIFQARGMICPDIVLGSQGTSLMSKPAHARGDHLSAPATRICTTPNSPSDTVVSPSGATSNPLSRPSSLNRVPTRHSVSTRPDSRLSTAITEASSTFGEQLETFEREAEEEGELHFPDSVVCE